MLVSWYNQGQITAQVNAKQYDSTNNKLKCMKDHQKAASQNEW